MIAICGQVVDLLPSQKMREALEAKASTGKLAVCTAIEEDLVVVLPSLKQARVVCLASQPALPPGLRLATDVDELEPEISTRIQPAKLITAHDLHEKWKSKVNECTPA